MGSGRPVPICGTGRVSPRAQKKFSSKGESSSGGKMQTSKCKIYDAQQKFLLEIFAELQSFFRRRRLPAGRQGSSSGGDF